eukprot:CAMPEP_0119052644 /NCGR_PEP_ID=MMETSP1177-20130426/73874_1 /TAXON_ID=2985 /ORGANISM="Ochromonas sp, Strain CCMP1899" /LENGTH=116 /DNA_ID=CAMNT_0007032281 /DNA_START=530 /DNA_END=880 /DNA_ORIENTATION=-
MKMVKNGADLEAIGTIQKFHPRNDLFAQEGTSKKWLQEVSEYYFAEARLQDVKFPFNGKNDGSPSSKCTFRFYHDPYEPLNSEDVTRNVKNVPLGSIMIHMSLLIQRMLQGMSILR